MGANLQLKDAWPGQLHREDASRHATRCGPGQLPNSKDECPTASILSGSVSAWSVQAWRMACRRSAVVGGDLPADMRSGAILHELAQQWQLRSDTPPCGGACSGCFSFLAAGSHNARGTPAARAANKIPSRADHKRHKLRGNPRLHRRPLCRDQRDGTLANDFVVIGHLDAKRRASLSKPFNPPSQLQRRSWWDRSLVLQLDRPSHHYFGDGVHVLLHLTDADGLNDCDQVPGRQAFDQSLRVIASMRKPGKQCSRRLLGRHAVGFFKGYFTNALVIHGYFWKGCRSSSAPVTRARRGDRNSFRSSCG